MADQLQIGNVLRLFLPATISLGLLLTGLLLNAGWVKLAVYLLAYLPVGLPVVLNMLRAIARKDFFSEFTLMTLATVGAFCIGEYPEGVAVMLFYTAGENIQDLAVRRAKGNIKDLLDQRPDKVTVIDSGIEQTIDAAQVTIGQVIRLKPGEKLALDGELLSSHASFNTAALTGESTPDSKLKGEAVYAGMINLNTVSEVRVTSAYTDSKLSRIISMVQDAAAQKAPTELFIRRFARVYTPVVVLFAVLIALVPAFVVSDYVFAEWLYRALVFLVISCPCALVISIPLGYFGGIGAASRYGILVKGSNYLDTLASVRHIVLDKTGTLTKGVFSVQQAVIQPGYDRTELLQLVGHAERNSTHPVATAILDYVGTSDVPVSIAYTEELPGLGLRSLANGKELVIGNFKLLERLHIPYPELPNTADQTVIAIAYDGQFAGYLFISDEIKSDAVDAINQLKVLGIQPTLLSGDRINVVRAVADRLGISEAYGDLLPEDKVKKFSEIRSAVGRVAFVGDGINDAPVIAISDVGIAMGALGSDATVETADVVIHDDAPKKLPLAIRIGRATRHIVWQNMIMAFSVKAIVLILGAGGLANMWEAVFADVGVALLAIANAVRIQQMRF